MGYGNVAPAPVRFWAPALVASMAPSSAVRATRPRAFGFMGRSSSRCGESGLGLRELPVERDAPLQIVKRRRYACALPVVLQALQVGHEVHVPPRLPVQANDDQLLVHAVLELPVRRP